MSLLPWFIRVVEMRVVLLLQKPKISREGMFDNWRFQNRALRHGVTFVRINTLGSTFCDGGRALFGFKRLEITAGWKKRLVLGKQGEKQEDLLGSLRYCRPEVDDSENI